MLKTIKNWIMDTINFLFVKFLHAMQIIVRWWQKWTS